MSPSKNHYTKPGSDESLYRLMNSSCLWMSHGNDWEAMMLQEALSTATQPLEKEKSHSGQIIRLEIVASLIFFLIVLIAQLANNSNGVSTQFDTHKFEQYKLMAY